ncbi:hypothetical protein BDW59DRAFT_157676 [Aspergillus cavernicola]|uniref:Ankyrin repeat-containing domain protein n=1 Tax=Aspergillus cavernicola TaxID=176166 RepID=A0ABR4IVC6_9EURO
MACDELGFTRSRDVVKRLEALPQGLHSLYQTLLEGARIQGDKDRQTVFRMLSFLATAQRAFSVAELSEACQLYEGEDEETRLSFTREDIEMCRLMLVVQDGLVRLLHKSVRDFLVRNRGLSRWTESKAHASLANRCISYFLSSLQSSGETGCQRLNTQFLQYAILHYPDHAGAAGLHFAILPEHESFFLPVSDQWGYWLSLYKTCKPFSTMARESTVLHVAARWGIPRLASFALASSRDILTGQSVTAELEAAEHGQVDVMTDLLENGMAGMELPKHVLCAAARNERSGKDLMQLLLDRRDYQVRLKENIVQAAARNQKYALDVVNLLLRRCGRQVLITDAVVRAASRNQKTGQEVTSLLLSQPQLQITDHGVEEILRAPRGKIFRITKSLVSATARNGQRRLAVMKFLLSHKEVQVSEKAMGRICASLNAELVELAINRQEGDFQVTQDIVSASARNEKNEEIYSSFDGETVKLLLSQRRTPLELTENAIRAAGRNRRSGSEVLGALLDQHKSHVPTGLCAVICQYFDAPTVAAMLARPGQPFPPIEDMALAAVRNQGSGPEVLSLLLDQLRDRALYYGSRGRRGCKEAIVRAAADNRWNGPEIMQLLLRDRKFHTTPRAVASICAYVDAEIITLLLVEHGTSVPMSRAVEPGNEQPVVQIPVTKAVVRAAAGSQYHGSKTIESAWSAGTITLLINQHGKTLQPTCGLVKVAAGNCASGPEVLELPLKHQAYKIEITADLARAAARNQTTGADIMKSLLDQGRHHVTAEAVVVMIYKYFDADIVLEAAAGNWNIEADTMAILLDKKWKHSQIPEGMLEAAASNWRHGAEVLEMLLGRHYSKPQITRNLVEIAVDNEGCGDNIIRIFIAFDSAQVKRLVSDDVLAAAATCGQDRILALLCQWIGSEIPSNLYAIAQLYNTAKRGDATLVRRILEDVVSPDMPNRRGVTLLWVAAANGHLKVVKLLLRLARSTSIAAQSLEDHLYSLQRPAAMRK